MHTLNELFACHSGKVSDKWELYLRVYDEIFSSRRADACRILEIGVQNGGSLEIWGKYFGNAKHIVGCDTDPACARLRFDDQRITVVTADANSPEAMAQISGISEEFDIIIDDGSHVPYDVIESFLNYFPRLSPGGLYVVEDLHCDYFDTHLGGILEPFTSTNFFFCLIQLMNRAHWKGDLAPEVFAEQFFPEGQLPEVIEDQWIDSITFRDSMVVIRRAMAAGASQLGRRVIAGEIADVNQNPVLLRQQTPNVSR